MELSLRDIILDIQIADKDSPLKGRRMFHSIDYVADSQKLWIDNEAGPGGSAYVFTFYDKAESEARTMIDGLGCYVFKKYGKERYMA